MRLLSRLRGNIHQPAGPHTKVVSLEAAWPIARRWGAQPPEQRLDDLLRHLVLNGKDIVEAAIEAFGPQVIAADGVDQLGIDADPSCGASGTAFEQVAHAEFPSDLSHVNRLSLVGKSRVAGDNEQARHPGKVGNQVFGQPIGEEFLLGIVTDIDEGQHSNGWPVGQRQSLSFDAAEQI
ncbi:hypothetical protein FHX14_001657 [Rhizobium sp. BK619]|nr:hypothetical protein [Rhizobium sp. BK619]